MMGFYRNDCESDHFASNYPSRQYVRKRETWDRVAFVYDKAAKTQTIVVNGAVVRSCTGSKPFLGTATVYLGKWGGGNLWTGKIKKVKIYNKALTRDQIESMQRNQ